ncbi:hypothetical protein BD413DRAFT_582636 [Trametes elegans]|nr:hypothetical protein BD413DRAFT_582636 [Trametes elegans]
MSSAHSHLDHAHDPNALHRFAHPAPNAYYQLAPHPQPALEPLSNQVAHPAYPSRQQPWLLNVQTTYPPHHQPSSLPDRPQPHSGFYSPGGPDSQLVGYPESSQRTLLHDASYAGLYTIPYPTSGPSFSYQNGYPASGPSDELQGALDSQNLARSSYRGVQGLSERRTAPYALSSQYLDGRGDLYGPGGPARLPANSSSAALAQLGGSPPSYAVSHSYGMGSPPSSYPHVTSDATPIMDVHSPRSGPYPVPIRRDSMDSLPDPISPSSVPGLVFDADDYDDDSESSLPSAASDVQRLPYRPPPQASADDRDYDAAAGRDWSRTSLEGQYGAPGASALALDEGVRQQARSPEPSPDAEPVTPEGPQAERARPPQKKSKMHQCTVCYKLFPRPSGLATHMNSHSGAKPFKCPIPTCTKSFAVRSNAKRHLRTHGIFPSAEHGSTSPSQFTVGFDTPLVSEVHEAGKLPSKLRWVPPSLATRSNIDYLRDAASDSEDEYFQPSCPLLPLPLPPVAPSSPAQWGPEDRYAEERNSYEQADSAPYISSQWRALPGPAIASPTGFN